MKKGIFTLFVLLIVCIGFVDGIAQGKKDFSSVDNYVLSLEENSFSTTEELAAALTSKFDTEAQKARAIFTWITHNIEFDTNERILNGTTKIDDGLVLYRRTANSLGFATLFKALSQYSNLESDIVLGHSKGYNFSRNPDTNFDVNHAWNAIKLDGTWQLLDATWGAGYLHDQTGVFVPRFEDHYFLTSPDIFISDHFPADEKWQLLNTAIDFEEYKSLVWKRPAFFRHGIEVNSHRSSKIEARTNERILLNVPEEQIVTARLMRDGVSHSVHHVLVQHEEDVVTIEVAPPARGNFDLEIFARGQHSVDEPFNHVMTYNLTSNRDITESAFPEVFGRFIVEKARLISPKSFLLDTDTRVAFNIVVPGATDVSVITNEKWQDLRKAGNNFTGEILVKEGKLQVAAKFQGDENYSVLLEYLVK